MATHQLIVLSNPVSTEREDEYNQWYEHTHLDEVLQVSGIVSAQRFAITAPRGDPKWRYAAAYDLDTDDATQVLADLTEAVTTMNMSDSIDGANAGLWILTPIGDRHVVDSTLTAG
jgi:hypothetical protein